MFSWRAESRPSEVADLVSLSQVEVREYSYHVRIVFRRRGTGMHGVRCDSTPTPTERPAWGQLILVRPGVCGRRRVRPASLASTGLGHSEECCTTAVSANCHGCACTDANVAVPIRRFPAVVSPGRSEVPLLRTGPLFSSRRFVYLWTEWRRVCHR